MTAVGWDDLTEADVDRLTVRVLRRSFRARPEVRQIRLQGEDAVVKDYGREGTLFKRLLGRYLVGREAAALRRAAGVPSVPRLLGRPRPWMLAIEYVDATRITALPSPRIDAVFIQRLTAIIDALHRRGIAHGDLEKLDNILVTADGRPAVVDFAAAIMLGLNPLAALGFPHVSDNDCRAVLKLKRAYAPELLTADERERLAQRSLVETAFRRLRAYIRRAIMALTSPAGRGGGRSA